MTKDELKVKAQRLIFNSHLTDFPVVLEMYLITFNVPGTMDKVSSDIIAIIRASEDKSTAFEMMTRYLDSLEIK